MFCQKQMQSFEESRRKSQQILIKEHENCVATVRLSEKNKQLLLLNKDYEKLCLAHQGMQNKIMMLEQNKVPTSSKNTMALRKEQCKKLKKLKKELRKIEKHAKQLQLQYTSIEVDAESRNTSLTKVLIGHVIMAKHQDIGCKNLVTNLMVPFE